ncbi:MAG TPA: FHA domain-containing protein [Usitatibacter sp.]|nr:FHA domain-containing protein [Usitatibacter sp.]
MGAVMWVEVLSRQGEVAARERIERPEARIGRAFDNDVVIDDPHVAPHHLRVYRGDDGELVAEDLGTLNGLYTEHGARRQARVSLAREPVIRIGRTSLRVHDGAHAVAPERPLTPPRLHARWAAGLAAGLFAAILLVNWLNLTAEPSANVILMPLVALAAVLAIWSGFWALLSRIFAGQSLFLLHLRIALTASLALLAWNELAQTTSFALAWREMAEYSGLGAWALLAATCYAHLHAIGPRHMHAAMTLVGALIIAGATVQYFDKWESRRQVGQRAALGDLRPPAFRAVPLAGTDDFLRRTETVKQRVDQSRVKEPPPGGSLSDFD